MFCSSPEGPTKHWFWASVREGEKTGVKLVAICNHAARCH